MASTSERSEHLNDARKSQLKARLLSERDKLRATLASNSGSFGAAEIEDPLLREPEDFGELASDITNEETAFAIAENDRRLLEQIERALLRMEEGSYGLSEVTGKRIPYERLVALPWATTNVDD